jgi:alpha-beta hydrolase superfamily lysophospholipase
MIMNPTTIKFFFTLLLTFFVSTLSAKDKFELIKYSTEDGGEIQAAFFNAGNEKAVIFAHGAIFNKESWYFLAKKFQENGVSALSIDFRGYGKSKGGESSQKYFDILGAVDYLVQQGYKEINLVGGSMGGAAVLTALSKKTVPLISNVILLSPAGGPVLTSETIHKLFIVSKKEGLYDRVINIYRQSVDPKILKTFDGSAHAQHMFKEDYSKELAQLILDTIVE